jgi:DNA-binding CsgD family transcriptional regulator
VPLPGDGAFERFCQAVTDFVCPSAEPAAAGFTARYTRRERGPLTLVAPGMDNLQIGAQLGLADKTVRNQLSALYRKLAVEGCSLAVVRARELGFWKRAVSPRVAEVGVRAGRHAAVPRPKLRAVDFSAHARGSAGSA